MKIQKGFTLIELIIVIVVLGILAVTAAPQFINFSSDAQDAVVEGLEGSIKGANQLVYAKANIAGVTDQTYDATDGYPTAGTYQTEYGYPAGSAGGIVAALNITASEWDIKYSSDTPAAGISVRFSPAGINRDDDNSGTVTYAEITECYVEYTPPGAEGSAPTVSTTAC